MRQDLTTGPVTRTMLLFALPMILGNILQQCYNLADTWIVGRFISTDALGAVGSAYTLMTFLTSLILGMCMGAGALFSISYGSKDLRRLGEYIASAFVLIVGLTVVLTGVSYGLLPSILRWMSTPEDVYAMMYAYVQVILVGLPFIFLYNYFAFLLRAVGNSLVPLVFLGVSTVLNIGLDVLLVAVIPCGVAGAAAATVIAQGVAGVGIAAYTLLREPLLRQGLRVRGRAAAEIFAYASTTGAQQSVMNFGILMVQGLVNSFGTAVMAAFAAGVKIDTLAYMPAQEFGNAYSIFISQNYGAGRGERIRAGTKSAVALVLGFCALVSALVWVLAPQLMGIFIPPHQAQSLAVGVGYLRIEGACYVGIGVLFLLYGYFRAVAQPRISLLLTVISLGTRVLLAYSCAPWFGVEAIWWAIPIGWALADLVGGGLVQRVQILRPLSGGTTGV
ncbi:MATE family efflux transporter [Pseudoflavonifractor sp. An176]|uniref:MATE family efflux transporter n=1 Tax=Pseudoflavonifractor sp. An176 TaxID=1965572 RepID=UPI000B376BE7|nr:MATE family efflux transporter [Pseudoflavonifractor sp. An176]OUP63994.1 MATE family efflux transporter [Pseudoflavonifractor sp. An176]